MGIIGIWRVYNSVTKSGVGQDNENKHREWGMKENLANVNSTCNIQ
jgi:hypothetical protein